MKLTYKQIARSAGYVAIEQFSSGGNSWRWSDKLGTDGASKDKFYTEEDAYKNCCIQCKLVEQ